MVRARLGRVAEDVGRACVESVKMTEDGVVDGEAAEVMVAEVVAEVGVVEMVGVTMGVARGLCMKKKKKRKTSRMCQEYNLGWGTWLTPSSRQPGDGIGSVAVIAVAPVAGKAWPYSQVGCELH